MRRAARFALLGGGTLGLVALLAAAPIAVVEGRCRLAPDPTPAPAPLAANVGPGYKRAFGDSYLSYPEWSIVHAYADLAGVARASSESDFDYAASIGGFWRGLCTATRAATRTGDFTASQTATNHVIALSFTLEMAAQGAYERSLGALTARSRSAPTAEDRFALAVLDDYAAFLEQTPWYDYPFFATLGRFWRETPFEPSPRALERRAALSVGYAVKGAYARLIALLAAADPAVLTIRSVVAGLGPEDLAADPRLRSLGEIPGTGATLIETPRYRAFTEVVRGLGARGRRVLEIAGNRRVLTTALLPEGALPPAVLSSDPGAPAASDIAGGRPLFAVALQSRPGWRRVGLDTPVEALGEQARAVGAAGGRFEHVYDY